jgi:hypothetical protein
MKKQLIAALLVLVLSSFACSLQNIQMETSETRTMNIVEALPFDMLETEIVLKMTGGKFNLSPGATDLVNGTIVYNVEQWEPEFTRRENRLEIKQTNPFKISGLPTQDVVNTWDLSLSNALPINLSIEGGASENLIDLTGLKLTNLKIIQGASETTVRFDAPNPITMEFLSFTTGVSSADIFGLGNANFQSMEFSGGAGDFTLDFTGTLTHDAVVNIKAGASNIKIIIPPGMKAVVNSQSTVTNINTEGTWLVSDDTYSTLVEGFTLTINMDLAVGNVKLIHLDQ